MAPWAGLGLIPDWCMWGRYYTIGLHFAHLTLNLYGFEGFPLSNISFKSMFPQCACFWDNSYVCLLLSCEKWFEMFVLKWSVNDVWLYWKGKKIKDDVFLYIKHLSHKYLGFFQLKCIKPYSHPRTVVVSEVFNVLRLFKCKINNS